MIHNPVDVAKDDRMTVSALLYLCCSDLELYFASAAAASSAAESLADLREGIQIDSGQTLPVAEESTAGNCI